MNARCIRIVLSRLKSSAVFAVCAGAGLVTYASLAAGDAAKSATPAVAATATPLAPPLAPTPAQALIAPPLAAPAAPAPPVAGAAIPAAVPAKAITAVTAAPATPAPGVAAAPAGPAPTTPLAPPVAITPATAAVPAPAGAAIPAAVSATAVTPAAAPPERVADRAPAPPTGGTYAAAAAALDSVAATPEPTTPAALGAGIPAPPVLPPGITDEAAAREGLMRDLLLTTGIQGELEQLDTLVAVTLQYYVERNPDQLSSKGFDDISDRRARFQRARDLCVACESSEPGCGRAHGDDSSGLVQRRERPASPAT